MYTVHSDGEFIILTSTTCSKT